MHLAKCQATTFTLLAIMITARREIILSDRMISRLWCLVSRFDSFALRLIHNALAAAMRVMRVHSKCASVLLASLTFGVAFPTYNARNECPRCSSSSSLCRAVYVEQSMSNSLSMPNSLWRVVYVEQSMSNSLCRAVYAKGAWMWAMRDSGSEHWAWAVWTVPAIIEILYTHTYILYT